MKESIFFNREQLKIIRWYGVFYSVLLKYGIFIFAGIVSLLGSWGILASGYGTNIALGEELSMNEAEKVISLFHQEKQGVVKDIPELKAKNLQGELRLSSGYLLKAKDVLLEFKEIVLPRLTSVSLETLRELANRGEKSDYDDVYLNHFFFSLIKVPLEVSYSDTNSALLALSGGIYDTFGLDCMDTTSSTSFVCKHYLAQFLDQFFFYELLSQSKPGAGENQRGSEMILDELQRIYEKIQYLPKQKKKFCQGVLRYGEYGGFLDDNLIPIMRSCGNEEYAQFLFLKDFASLAEGFSLGFVDARVYSTALFNQYKLFSLQQLLYKQLSSSVDSKAVMISYFQFLREILIKEENRKTELVSPFAKTFSYRYNTNILSPYLKDEKSKMSKEDRSFLMSQLLSLNYGDKLANFIGLEEQSSYKKGNASSEEVQQTVVDLEKLFRSSYLPNNFSLTSLKKQDDTHLNVKGVDRKTSLVVEANLVYQDIQLSVTSLTVENNKKLTEYMNALIANNRYSLNKVLGLLYENKDIAQQAELGKRDICVLMKEKFEKNLISCSNEKVEIRNPSGTEQNSGVVYTFGLTNNVLSSLQVSDKALELKLLKELNFSLLDATTTPHMMVSLVGYIPQEENAGFGMKDHLLIIDRFAKYLGVSPESVLIDGANIRVHFKIQDISFQATYDPVKSELSAIALDFGAQRRPVIIQNFSLLLQEENLERINAFVSQPLEVLRGINAALVKRYFPEQ